MKEETIMEVDEQEENNKEEAIRKAVERTKIDNRNFVEENDDAISQQKIDHWKAQYGSIFSTTIGDQVFVWHKMRRKDYVDIMQATGTDATDVEADAKLFERQDEITKKVVLWPEDKELVAKLIEENGGYASAIADEVMIRSGFRRTVTTEL